MMSYIHTELFNINPGPASIPVPAKMTSPGQTSPGPG